MKDIFKMVANQNGVSEEEVREEIEKSIHEAYLQKSPEFVKMFGDREPTPEEFLEMMVMRVGKLS